MAKNIRNVNGNHIQDPATLHNLEYNNAAGSKKVSEVGRHPLPLKFIAGGTTLTYTTDATTARALDHPGKCLAVYNNAAAVGSVTLGESAAVASLAPGAVDSAGHVGIPCAPNSWTYIACGNQNWVISSAATLLVFLVDDETSIKQEAVR